MQKNLARSALAVLLVDLGLKLIPLGARKALLPGLLQLVSTRNQGVAFGLLAGHPFLSLLLGCLLVLSLALWLRSQALPPFEGLCAGLMLGGALGNLADRLLHGAVYDYLQFSFVSFPAFNLADACLSIGALLLAVRLLVPAKGGQHG